jgi:hypothetical protein
MSYLIKSDFFPASSEHAFTHFDSEQQFAINQRELGPGWRWHDVEFTYRINDYGYRMNKDLHEVDFSNYIAFFGCSYTFGSGLPLQETFAYKIAQQKKMDYVNAAVVGSSTDFVFYNFTKLISTVPMLPKIVVINWPDVARTLYWYKNNIVNFLPYLTPRAGHPMLPDGIKFWNNAYKSHVLETSNYTNRFEYIRQNIITVCKLAGIKLFEFTTEEAHAYSNIHVIPAMPAWNNTKFQGQDLVNFANWYFARDIMPKNYSMFDFLKLAPELTGWAHPGISYQNRVVKEFFSKIAI